MTLEELKTWLNGMPPEERKQMLDALYSSYDERGEQLTTEQEYADRLREEPMPGMRDTGKFMIAANPLEFASTVAHRGLGGYRSRKIKEQREEMARMKEAATQALIEQLLAAGGGPATPAAPGMASPSGASPPMMAAQNPAPNFLALLQGLRRG